jgi:hypothetical protein
MLYVKFGFLYNLKFIKYMLITPLHSIDLSTTNLPSIYFFLRNSLDKYVEHK